MKKIGTYLSLIGVFAIILFLINRVPSIFAWMYNWGDSIAWAIMVGMVVVGVVLFILGSKPK